MAISLFPHNQEAYEAVLSMLSKTGKACVIHPTGTGKSFIGFKYCEDHPEQRICWLAPSEYIFKTQCENLIATGAAVPSNITFLTYAKLNIMTQEETAKLRPDMILQDEFHRAGAPTWQLSLTRFLMSYPQAKLLGFSATNVRYLDNQRDMAEEIYDNCVASKMTLGEAIVRGILNPPTYVTCLYSYQEDLKQLENRVHHAKSKAVRDSAEEYLEALRRALAKADGLEEIFHKYMSTYDGKYLVFCASKEHMDQMLEKVAEWFSKVDAAPHIYVAYADDPKTEAAFCEFKRDESAHLKLLFCIDMLNEGVHVEDVDGVILFRPTVSPIIFKQQIGRALSAKKDRNPIIFDIVNNFENLYSIGAIEQEMRDAVDYFQSSGEENKVATEHFRLIDEVRDCRRLFDELEETLSASWDTMYGYAKQYYQQFGNLEIPKQYKTSEGYSLGMWILTQRRVRAGSVHGTLGEERIQKLDAIGMVWKHFSDISWERNLAEAIKYREKYGDLLVPRTYISETGVPLGAWVARQRQARKNSNQRYILTEKQIRQLNELGMVWDVADELWGKYYAAAQSYHDSFGNLDVPTTYISAEGVKLGEWISRIRNKRDGMSLTEGQRQKLDALGMLWESKFDQMWEEGYRHAAEYFKKNGNLNVATMFCAEDGYALGRWVARQRKVFLKYNNDRLARLRTIGMIWEKEDSWTVRYRLAEQYYKEHGDLKIPGGYVMNGVWINKWLSEMRKKYRNGQLTQAQICALERLGMEWDSRAERDWNMRYQLVKAYYDRHGNLKFPHDTQEYRQLEAWLDRQKRSYESGKQSKEHLEKLKQIGFNPEAYQSKIRRPKKSAALKSTEVAL
ncbi:hypothetical protein D1159_11140 [Pseudoflavonifractor sp. 524-17]|uniref:Helicase associated domain protein n=1 Tax=Pseudoflavonifractor sp. 524-17 TaxID=2304577 RepID=UPI00137A1776|nr:Helicase associated domain protein [Pseudoflavonifractor sp. 524-17]NCE65113.1 hypothetical protein [Pseudoflavonifractor sp. 524-17]